MHQPDPRHARPVAWGVTFSDLAGSMLWPRLLRAARLAARPARVGIGLVVIALIVLVGQLPLLWLDAPAAEKQPFDPFGPARPAAVSAHTDATSVGPLGLALDRIDGATGAIWRGVRELDIIGLIGGVWDLIVATPLDVFREYPWSSLALAIPVALIWGIGGGAIARTAATEFSIQRRIPWTKGVAFSLSRGGSMLMATVGPLLVVGIVAGVLALLGYILLGSSLMRVFGGAVYIVLLLLGALGMVLTVLYALASPMLTPAVACEGTDAIDAIQRCYAYAVAKPLRLTLYILVIIVQGAVVISILAGLAQAVSSFTAYASTALVAEPARGVLSAAATVGSVPAADENAPRMAARFVAFWGKVPLLLVAAYAVSYWFSAGSVLYLLTRQLCDGQDQGELWTPGNSPGSYSSRGDIDPGEDGQGLD